MNTVQFRTQSTISTLILSFVIFNLLIFSSSIKGQNYPAGFQQVLVANGMSNPTVMAFAPLPLVLIKISNSTFALELHLFHLNEMHS
jgi:hypothetical protein